MAKQNQKHTFDFTGVLGAKIDQKDWKEKKKLLEEQFGHFKIALDGELAEAEAQKILDMFNEKLNIQLNVEQVKKDAEAVKKIIENALASINNIDTSALRGIEDTLDRIATTTDNIAKKMGKGIKTAVDSGIASINKLDDTIRDLKGDLSSIDDAFNFDIKDDASQQLKYLTKLQNNLNKALQEGSWLEQQKALVKYAKAYEATRAKFEQDGSYDLGKFDKRYSAYQENRGKISDAKINLQNLMARSNGGDLIGIDTSALATEDTLRKIANKLDHLKVNVDSGNQNTNNQTQPSKTSNQAVKTQNKKSLSLRVLPKELEYAADNTTTQLKALLNSISELSQNGKDELMSMVARLRNGEELKDIIKEIPSALSEQDLDVIETHFQNQKTELINRILGYKDIRELDTQFTTKDKKDAAKFGIGKNLREVEEYWKQNHDKPIVPIKPAIEPKDVEQEIVESTGGKPVEVPIVPVVSEDLAKKKTRLATINRALTDINPSDKVRDNKDAAEYWYQQKHIGNGSAYEGLIKYVEAYDKVKSSGSKDKKWLDQYMPTKDDLAKYKSVKEKLIQEKQQLETELSTIKVQSQESAVSPKVTTTPIQQPIGATVAIDETILGNAIANALKGVQLNTNTKGEVKASINATELKGILHDGTVYDVNIVDEKILIDNYGNELSEAINKSMRSTQLLDEQGQIIKLFHNSSNVFDKFESPYKSKQGKTLGAGNYLALEQDSKYNSLNFGRFQTEWYANLQKIFDNQEDILPKEKLVAIINKYLPELTGDAVEKFLGNFIKGFTAQGVKFLAQNANVSSLDIWRDLGYDAVKDKDQINIFDSSKIRRANNSVLDIATNQKITESKDNSTLTEIKNILESIKTNTNKFVTDNINPRTEILTEDELNNLDSKSINWMQITTALVQIASILTAKTIETALGANTSAVEAFTQHLSGQTSYFDSLQGILGGITDAFEQSNISATIITTSDTLETLNNTLRGISSLVVVPTDVDTAPQTSVNLENLIEEVSGVGKVKIIRNAAGQPLQRADTTVERTKNAVKTQTNIFGYEKGNAVPKGTITVEDFDRFIKEQKSEAQKIKTAQAKLKEFLTQFNNKTLGKVEQISGYNELGELLNTDWKLDTIEKAKQGMLALNAEFNKLSQNFRKGSSSLNPFVNAINNTEKLESQIKNIQLDFTALKNTPAELYTTVDGLQDDFSNVMSLKDGNDIEAYSLAYGNLREKIVKVVNEIRILRKEQGITQKSALFDENKEVIGARSDTQVQEWERMSYIPDELRDKFRLLHSELNNVVDQEELNIWKKQWEQIRVQITALRREHQGMEADLKEVLTIYEEIGRNEAKIEGLQSEGEKDVYRNRNIALKKEAEELAKIYGLNVDLAAIEKVRTDAKKSAMVRVDVAQERQTLQERIKTQRKEARINASNTKLNAGNNVLDSVLWKIDDEDINVSQIPAIKQLEQALKDLAEAQKRADNAIKNNTKDAPKAIDSLKTHSQTVAGLTANVKELLSNYERFSGDNATKLGGFAGGDWEQQVTAAIEAQYPSAKIKSINHDLQEVTYEVKSGARAFTEYTAGVRIADKQIVALKGTTKKLPTFLEGVKRKLGEISQYFSAMSVINRAMQELRKGLQYVKEIDLALTELKKVTDETEEAYDKFLDTAAQTGARLGTPISAVIEATATFAKLGYTMKQASEMAEAAIVYKNVGDGIASTEDAADSIISTLKGFGMEATETMRIVDRFNEVGNRFAITSKGIGEALRLSASALNEGGNSLDESIALITAANEVVNDPSSVGTALKTLTLRLRGSKTELEEMGEDVSDMANTTSQLQAKLLALTGGKVDIMLDSNTFKNSTQILREMAEAWSSMDDISRASALELMGGKRQANVLSALIQNFDTAEEVIKTSANSAGSALKENEKYLDSIQGKIDQFTNALQTMWKNALDDDVVKFFVDIGKALVQILDKLGPIKTVIAGIMAYITKKYSVDIFSLIPKNVDNTKKKIAELKTEIASLDGLESQKSLQKKDALTQQLRTLEAQVAPSQEMQKVMQSKTSADKTLETLKQNQAKYQVGSKEYNNYAKAISMAEGKAKKAQGTITQLTEANKNAGKSGSVAFKNLGKSVKNFAIEAGKAIAQMVVMWAIMKLLELGKELIDYLITTPEEAAEKFEELTNQLKETKNELEGINDELTTLDDKIAELTAKGKLSFTEQEELERLRAEREELERELKLKKALAQQQQEQVNSQTSDQVEYYKNKGVKSGKTVGENVGSAALTAGGIGLGVTAAAAGAAASGIALFGAANAWNPVGWIALAAAGVTALVAGVTWAIAEGEESVGESIDNMEANLAKKEEELQKARDKYQNSGSDKDKKKYEEAQQALSDYRGEMSKYFTELGAYYDNVDLSEVEDPERYKELKKEMNDFYNERDKWLITSGSEGATSNAIERVFDKKENKKVKEEIESLMEQLKEDPGNTAIEQKIKSIISGSGTLKSDFEAIGIEIDDVARSFTQMAEDQLFGTIDGKVTELERATAAFKNLLNGERFNFEGKNIGLADLFTDEGEVIQTKLSGIFKNTSSETREAITGLLERSYDDIQNGTVNIETLLGEFASRGSEAILSILEATSDTFEEISENMDKIQDSYSTLSNAVEQYNSAGFLTLDNLQSLLSLEPEYLALLQMENGQLTINQAGYEALVQTKLAEAKASVVQSTMKQLNALAARKEADATNDASTAAANSISNLGAYASILSDVAKNAIGAASSVYAFNNAVAGAQANELVTQEEIDAIISSMDTQLQMIDSVGANLSTNFSGIMTGGEGGNPKDGGEDSDEWEKLLKKHQAKLDAITYEKDLIQAEIDKAEAKGLIASEEHYRRLIVLEEQEKNALIAKQKAMQDFYNTNSASMSADEIDKWNAEMRDTSLAIKEADTNMIEFGNTIREIGEEYFSKVSEDIDAINEEIEFMHGLLEDEPVADENGNWSNEALTRLGLYTQQMEKAAFETQRAKDELAKLQATTSEAEKNTDWYREREEELTQAIYDGVNSYNDAKDGIVELNEARVEAIKEGIEKEIEAYNDLIENKKEALDAERDLYDFKKSIEEQNKSIADTERKLAALSGSTAAEDIAERKRLEAELRKQQGNLDDTYYDHSMTAQQNALDEEGRYFEEAQQRRIESLEAMLENTEELIVNSMMDVMLNADTVHQTLNEQANTYGVTLSEELTKPWLDASAQAIKWRDELKRDMTEGEWASMIGEGGAITAFSNGVATKLGGSWDTAKTKAKAYSDFLTGNELKKNFSGAITTFVSYLQKIVDKWNAIRDAANAATSVTPTVPSGGASGGSGSGGSSGGTSSNNTPASTSTPVKKTTTPTRVSPPTRPTFKKVGDLWSGVGHTGVSIGKKTYNKALEIEGSDAIYYPYTNGNGYKGYIRKGEGYTVLGNGKMDIQSLKPIYQKYAKGTLETKRDEFAITDESWIGEEITLAAGKNGQLQYLKKGSSVLPADISANLVEWGKFNPNMLNISKFDSGINVINSAVNKPEVRVEFDSLVHVDHCDQNTLKDLEKMVDNKINQFGKQMNYALKGVR